MEPSNPAIDAVAASGVPFAVKRTERAHSAEESATFQGIELGDLLRTIVVRRGEDDYLFVLVPAGRRFDWPKLRALLGVTRLSLPDADEAQRGDRLRTGHDHARSGPAGPGRSSPMPRSSAGHVWRSAAGPTA